MTTVPNPFTEKLRSTFRRGGNLDASRVIWLQRSVISARNWSIPISAKASVAIIGASAKAVPWNCSRISSCTISSKISSTPSTFVKTMMKFSIPKRRKIFACSDVCGIIPSFASITNNAKSKPGAPANIFFKNFSCPGTSTIPASVPSSKVI